MRVSVVIPVFNERDTVEHLVEVVKSVPVEKEIVIVDDFSSDGTRDKLLWSRGKESEEAV